MTQTRALDAQQGRNGTLDRSHVALGNPATTSITPGWSTFSKEVPRRSGLHSTLDRSCMSKRRSSTSSARVLPTRSAAQVEESAVDTNGLGVTPPTGATPWPHAWRWFLAVEA